MTRIEELTSIKLRLYTETPVSIGGDEGKSLSPYADYVFSGDGKYLLYLNQQAISNALGKDLSLMNEFVEAVRTRIDNNRSNFDLKNFLTNRLRLNLEDSGVVSRRVPVYGLSSNERQEIRPIEKAGHQVYLPGSSIKGAIRTAALYDWLVKTKAGEPVVRDLEKELQKVESIRRSNPNPRRMSWEARQEMRKLEREFFPEEKLFGSLRWKGGPDARRIRVSDTETTTQGLGVYSLKRIRLTPNPRGESKSQIPITREALHSSEPLHFSLSILKGFESPILKYWEENSPKEILAILNGFTQDALINELFELNNAPGGSFGEEIAELVDFYTTLLNRVREGEVFLRLGFGKTIYDNSLALVIQNGIADEQAAYDAFDIYRQSFWRMNRHASTYPATRTITPDGKPMGWVKVELAE